MNGVINTVSGKLRLAAVKPAAEPVEVAEAKQAQAESETRPGHGWIILPIMD